MESGPNIINNLNTRHSYSVQPNVNFSLVPFDNLHLNVEPIVLFRPLNTFARWLTIICVKKDNPSYNILQSFIKDLTSNLDCGNIVNIDTTTTICKNNEISKYKWYSIDLRSDKDNTLNNKININFVDDIDSWYKTLYFDKIYNKCKGLVIYADSLEDIPSTMLARCNIGLCEYTEYNLANFIYKCTGKYLQNVMPVNASKEIVGFVNAHKWTKLVKL